MRFGISLLNFTLAPDRPDLGELWEYGKRAEELGFGSLWVYDHVLLGTKRAYSFFDPFVVLGGLAPLTKKASLGTSVYLLALRNPIETARVVATIDHASAGRFRFGIGAGWYSKEFETLGVPYKQRGGIMEESVEVMKKLWTQDAVSHAGKHFKFDSVVLEPKPLQKPYPPILLGGHEDVALRRVPKLASGWIAFFENPRFIQQARTKIQGYANRALVTTKPSISAIIPACLAKTDSEARGELERFIETNFNRPFMEVEEASAYGTPETCRGRIDMFEEAGVDELIFLQTETNIQRLEEFHAKVVSR